MEVYSTIAIATLLFGFFQRAALFEYFPNLGVLFEVSFMPPSGPTPVLDRVNAFLANIARRSLT